MPWFTPLPDEIHKLFPADWWPCWGEANRTVLDTYPTSLSRVSPRAGWLARSFSRPGLSKPGRTDHPFACRGWGPPQRGRGSPNHESCCRTPKEELRHG